MSRQESVQLPPLDRVAAVCTIDESDVKFGGPSEVPAQMPFVAVEVGKLDLDKGGPWSCDVLCHQVPVDASSSSSIESLTRMKKLFVGRSHECDKLVTLHGMMRSRGAIWVIMERTTGGILRNLLTKNQSLSVRSSLQILLDVAEAIKYLHARNILHRMLTASSVHLTNLGRAKVGDFAFCREHTSAMTNVGIPSYAAPEILRGATEYTDKVDVYSFAMLIVEVVTKHQPYANVDAPEAKILDFIVHRGYRPVFTRTSEWPADLFTLMEKCWHPDPEERPSFDEIVPRLEAML